MLRAQDGAQEVTPTPPPRPEHLNTEVPVDPWPHQESLSLSRKLPQHLFLPLPLLTCQDTQLPAPSSTCPPLPIPGQPGSEETVHTHCYLSLTCIPPHATWFQLSPLAPNYHSAENTQQLPDLRALFIHSFTPLTTQCLVSNFYVPGLRKGLDSLLCHLHLSPSLSSGNYEGTWSWFPPTYLQVPGAPPALKC